MEKSNMYELGEQLAGLLKEFNKTTIKEAARNEM